MKRILRSIDGKEEKFVECPECRVLIPLEKFKRHYKSKECKEYKKQKLGELGKQVAKYLNKVLR
jgi:hypothetical protein